VSQKRVVLVVSIEGIDRWVDEQLWRKFHNPMVFNKSGTMKELQRVELGDGESIVVRKVGCETPAQ
jgi:hypothetical protein